LVAALANGLAAVILPQKIVMPAAKKASPAKPQATVTLKHLAVALSDSHDLPKKQAEAVLGDLVTLTTRHLKKGNKIRLTGLGILQVRKRAARMGRNPATGEAIKIKASKKVAFRVCQGTEGSGVGRAAQQGLQETEASITNKLARATVPATFLLAALGMDGMKLDDL
jgi:DNA-binding protein HU-beta